VKIIFLHLLIALATLLSMSATAASFDTDFDAANKLYGQGKFPEAAGVYEKMIQSGAVSPALYFNLGDAYFKSAQIGHAIAAYRRAAQMTPRDADIRANLQFARNQVTGPTMPASRWEKALSQLSLNEWTWLTVLAFWTLFIFLAVRQLRPQWRNSGFVLGAAAAFVIFGAGLGVMVFLHHQDLAVVVDRQATIRTGPFEESPDSFTANDGAELQVLDQKDNWLQVTDGHGRVGWLKREIVAVIPEV
jgi:tetratricopeptide (TPR) repeat protein